ncbi:LysR family transcriptional regulator [Pseudomonas sp. OA3]|jgi:DNA-binding transcriptional LysR family regulator|nr:MULTISPECIES: LysR family transcriptional regulator [Pseudomonas]MBG0844105.1 LysR family transcriptional regulator [Pseudomonas chengduensis]MBJ7545476.1 LysR family transcriptional regulator [Pseudomonas sp. OA3]MDH1730821.1 LysR family transcriptional regulator [Pseudomonas chengduensis]WFS20007.1 LysR family transcriptional regulator [Pseudomonas sp. 905_Psudmo1]
MNIAKKDLNLLLVFHVLYQERNASLAAERMALSQPALSHKLNKLRHQFGDPLFVRAPRGVTPTPRAHELAPQVQRLVGELEGFYERCDGQDFLSRVERLHLYSTDYIEQTLLPRLLPILRQHAPNLVLVTHNTRGQLPRDELEKGTCDLAIAGFYKDLPGTFHQQRLLSEDFVVLAAHDNPHLADGLDLQRFVTCEHLITTLTGDLEGLVDRALQQRGLQRRIAAGLSSFVAPARLLRGSDLLLTCLRSLAEEAVARDPELRMHPLPLELPRVEVMQIWHERTHADPLRSWFRRQVQAVAQRAAQDSGP